jgi:hypothetical protein
VLDSIVNLGYIKHDFNANAFYTKQVTQGGGDIRRQDTPFVSNRMNFSKVGGMVMIPLPKFDKFSVELAASYTLDGRNVGQSTTITTGLFYRFHAFGSPTR